MFSEDTILLFYEITDVIIAGLSTGSVYALMAVGMTLVYGVTKAFNFAYGDFFNMGGYFAWILIFGLGLHFGGYMMILVIVMPLMFAVGYGLEKLMIAPLRKRDDWENKVMMLTLGLSLFLASLYMVVFGTRMKSLPPILEGTLDVGQLVFAYQDIMIFCMSLGGILIFGWLLNNTRTGMGRAGRGPESARGQNRRYPAGTHFCRHLCHFDGHGGFRRHPAEPEMVHQPQLRWHHHGQGLGGHGPSAAWAPSAAGFMPPLSSACWRRLWAGCSA